MTLIFLVLAAIFVYYFFIHKSETGNGIKQYGKEHCPNCNNPIESSFNICPICKETLKMKCPHCGERLQHQWKYCPYCEKETKKRDAG